MLIVVFHGSVREAGDLSAAVAHNCACEDGQRCGAHAAIMSQRFVDGILFARHLRTRLEAEEWEENT